MNNSAEDVVKDRTMSYEERREILGSQCRYRRRVLMKISRGLQEFQEDERACYENCNNTNCASGDKKETVQDYLERNNLRSDPHTTSNS